MKLVVEGVMNGNLPWALVLAGVFIAIVVEIIGIPVLAFAVGLYLPIYLSTPMMVGGLVRLYFDKKKMEDSERRDKIENGLLYSSGLIAGEGIIGILLALFAVFHIDLNISKTISLGNIGGVIFYALLTWTLVLLITFSKRNSYTDFTTLLCSTDGTLFFGKHPFLRAGSDFSSRHPVESSPVAVIFK